MPHQDTSPAPPSPYAQVARLVDGYLVTQLLHIAAELGIADRLAAGPRTAAELSQESAPIRPRSSAFCAGWRPKTCWRNTPTAGSG